MQSQLIGNIRPWTLAVAVLVSFMFAAQASAQTVLEGGQVHTVAGDVIEDGVVILGDDGTISEVGGPDTAIPDGAEVIDVSGQVVTPGFVESFSQLGIAEIWSVGSTVDSNAGGSDPIRAAFRAADGFNPNSVVIPIARGGGVTSAIVAPYGGLVSGQAAWVRLGPESASSSGVQAYVDRQTAAMVINHGERGARAAGRSRGAAVEKLRELYDDVRYFQNRIGEYNQNRMRELTASRLDLLSLVPTLDGVPVMFRVHRGSDISAVLRLSDEIGLDPIIVGGAEAWQVADELAERQVPVIVNPLSNLPARFSMLGARADNAAILSQAGVPVVLSSFETHKVRKLRQVAGNAVRAGMGYEAALEAVTAAPARAMGRDDIGTLEPGNRADVVVWSGDPFEMSTRVEQYFVGGQSVDLDSRQEQLFERYRKLERRDDPAPRR